MTKAWFRFLVAAAVVALPLRAGAAALSSASLLVEIGTLPSSTFPATGATGTATSSLSATLGAGSAFAGTSARTLTGTITGVLLSVKNNVAAAFTGTAPSNVGAAAGVTGQAIIKGFGVTLLKVPVALGTPGTLFATQLTKMGGPGVAITAVGGSWTAGTAKVTGIPTGTGTATVASTRMGSNMLTAGGSGTLQLVSAVKVTTNLAPSPVVPTFGTLTLTYGAPEPAAALLLMAGAGALVAAGRRRGSASGGSSRAR
jgi:hypothetical protein